MKDLRHICHECGEEGMIVLCPLPSLHLPGQWRHPLYILLNHIPALTYCTHRKGGGFKERLATVVSLCWE